MSKEQKKATRNVFRNRVFERDHWRCCVCQSPKGQFDAHHITPRDEMPNGGYVVENGITLCTECHILAEEYIYDEEGPWSRSALYKKVGSNYSKAYAASLKLGCDS